MVQGNLLFLKFEFGPEIIESYFGFRILNVLQASEHVAKCCFVLNSNGLVSLTEFLRCFHFSTFCFMINKSFYNKLFCRL